VEQRTDETARQPRVAAEDADAPPAEDGQADIGPSADRDVGEDNGHADEGEPVWSPAALPDTDASRDQPAGRQPGAPGSSFRTPPADAGQPGTSERTYQAATDRVYPPSTSGDAYPTDTAYAGPSVDGYGSPGTERDFPAASTQAHDFPSASVTGPNYGAAPADSIYGASAGSQRDLSAPPYPAQVTAPQRAQSDSRPPSDSRTRPETEPPEKPSPWQAAAARVPRPQSVPKQPKAQRSEKSGAPARQAHLMVSRFEPWSVMKFSFMISLACFVILFIAVTLLYGTLAGLGVFDSIQKALSNVTSGQGTAGVNVSHYFSASLILSYTALLGVFNVFLITAFATVGSVIYNLTAHLVGGVEVTLRETE
jgi:Transmembrane domain of unknown function (DUF3566)